MVGPFEDPAKMADAIRPFYTNDFVRNGTASQQLTGPVENDPKEDFFYVVHPLDDLPEEKVKSDHLPPLTMTQTVRWPLFTLRAYLIIMMLLLVYHVVNLARQLWR